MAVEVVMQKTIPFILMIFLWLIYASIPVHAVETDMTHILPAPACHPDWHMDGQITFFNKDTLFDHINGESELYFPYGFELLAFARYVNKLDPKAAFDADVYKMGSLLNAFGMYANYRRKDDAAVTVGADGSASSSQLIFYQDRYLVRLQASGTTNPAPDIFLACARAISEKLPQDKSRPKDLDAFNLPDIDPKTVRYIAQSLLGYEFFQKGIMADATINQQPIQVFLVIENSAEAARKAFDRYGEYLKTTGVPVPMADNQKPASLKARDPMYGNVVVEQQGPFIYGAIRLKDDTGVQPLIEKLRNQMAGLASSQK
jgi:hypothetical protein